jgi:hypothetical protein
MHHLGVVRSQVFCEPGEIGKQNGDDFALRAQELDP